MTSAAKIDAATALRYLRDLPDDDVLITAAHKRTTGLTVADLRELLAAARDGGWRDAVRQKPNHCRTVEVELCDGQIGTGVWDEYYGAWAGFRPESVMRSHAPVRRWRELPR